MAEKGHKLSGAGLGYQWLPRSQVAGRFCPTDQAGPRPKAVTRNLLVVGLEFQLRTPHLAGSAKHTARTRGTSRLRQHGIHGTEVPFARS